VPRTDRTGRPIPLGLAVQRRLEPSKEVLGRLEWIPVPGSNATGGRGEGKGWKRGGDPLNQRRDFYYAKHDAGRALL